MRSNRGKTRWGGGRTRMQFGHTYEDIIFVENLLAAWKEFVRGKRKKRDVQEFQHALMDNVLALHRDLALGTYRHGGYHAFKISDPKPRDIHKASVRDRLLHHALYRMLYPFFDRTFIADSYSCRKGKGTHRAMNHFRSFAYNVSRNHTRTCWVLKCDVRKFFASGVDFLGWVHFRDHRVLRTSTKRRMLARIADIESDNVLNSYRGLLSHGNAHTLARLLQKPDSFV